MNAGLLPAVGSSPDTDAVSSENGEMTSNLSVYSLQKMARCHLQLLMLQLADCWRSENGLGMCHDTGC